MRLLDDHVRRFNEGVRSGDFGPMVAAFAAAYREQPPDDEIEILGSDERDGMVVARYAWLRQNGRQAGEMRLTPQDGRIIKKLVVTFG